jgi:hypothetical protein
MHPAFICSPYGGKRHNYNLAKACMRMAAEKGYYPMAPHVMIHGILDDSDPHVRNGALQVGIQLIDLCKRVFVFGDRITPGMEFEIEYARSKSYGIVFIHENEIKAWLENNYVKTTLYPESGKIDIYSEK